MEIRTFEDLGDPDLGAAWRSLESAGRCPSVFVTYAWVTVWARQFARDAAPMIVVGYDGSEAVGLAPLFATSDAWVELPVNFLSHKGEFLLGDGADRFVRAVLSTVRRKGLRLRLRSVPGGSRTHESLRRHAAAGGFFFCEKPNRVSPYLTITTSWEEYLATLPKSRRYSWERRIRKLRRAGDVSIRVTDDSTDIGWLVDMFVDVEARSWKEREGTSIRRRGLEAFYKDLCGALADQGWLWAFWLEFDGRPIAFILGAVFDGTYYLLKPSYDEEYARLSPGTCLLHWTVRQAFGRGLSGIDFLGQTARWKREWATGERPHADVLMHPRHPAGLARHLLEAVAKPVARRLVRR